MSKVKKKPKKKFKIKLPYVDPLTFLYVALITFVFVASSALSINRKLEKPQLQVVKPKEQIFSPLPVLSSSVSFPILSAQAALAVDIDSGVTLYEKKPEEPLLPASTTKIMTALVAMDFYPLDMVLKVGGVKVDGRKMGLREGEEIRVDDLLLGLLIISANDAAEVLASNYCAPRIPTGSGEVGPCGREVFISNMNVKAESLGLNNTNFVNPTGFDDKGHISTARDLIRVAIVAMENKDFAEMVATKEKHVTSFDGRIAHKLVNINELIGEVEGVLGVKTGWTENARENLVTYIERDEKKIMLALLGSQDRFGETKELIEWIFKSYEWEEVIYP